MEEGSGQKAKGS